VFADSRKLSLKVFLRFLANVYRRKSNENCRYRCRAAKSREGDHFQGSIGIPSLLGEKPEVPDWAYDMHTTRGRQYGRGLDHFRTESARLVPPANIDLYEVEFYTARKRQINQINSINESQGMLV